MELNEIKYDNDGLVPVIVQDFNNGRVLMLAYADQKAITETLRTSRSHFWSRSRKKIWMKGEESGHIQHIRGIYYDCDADTLLYMVVQEGVACHTGNETCFFRAISEAEELPPFLKNEQIDFIDKVFNVIEDRKRNPSADSYVSSLLTSDLGKVLKKIGEESTETVIAAMDGKKEEFIYEITDLWFHSLVLLSRLGLSPGDINRELERRFGKSKKDYSLE